MSAFANDGNFLAKFLTAQQRVAARGGVETSTGAAAAGTAQQQPYPQQNPQLPVPAQQPCQVPVQQPLQPQQLQSAWTQQQPQRPYASAYHGQPHPPPWKPHSETKANGLNSQYSGIQAARPMSSSIKSPVKIIQ